MNVQEISAIFALAEQAAPALLGIYDTARTLLGHAQRGGALSDQEWDEMHGAGFRMLSHLCGHDRAVEAFGDAVPAGLEDPAVVEALHAAANLPTATPGLTHDQQAAIAVAIPSLPPVVEPEAHPEGVDRLMDSGAA